ncbi:TetR/AcrR family transcriptional regulator [Nocardioides psychrotolerans]|uniref:TetR/AcrR family transcriptional regulator n=1 Tax=Nocardioides psychrotolerans TaxID=1005945 RepID=UPI0031379E72
MAQKQRIRPSQARAVQMRRDLLDATLHLLATDGAERLTTTAIVERAHVSSGTFYRYFNDRAEILGVLRDEAVEAISTDLMAGVVRALDHDLDGGVREIVLTLVDAFERHRAVILAMVNAMPAGSNANILPEVESRLFQLASVLPRRHLPHLSPARMEAVVFMTMGVLVSTCLRVALMRPDGVDRDEVVDITAAMITAGLRAG